MGGRGKFAPTLPRSERQERIKRERVIAPNVPQTLKQALGTKGKPATITEAATSSNPYFSRLYSAYSENCQRCVVAYELQRRGYNVGALPTYQGDKLPNIAYYRPQTNTREGRWKGAFQNAKTVHVGVNGNTKDATSKVIDNITTRMRDFGNGSRAVIQLFWKVGGGHVFNIENDNGRIVAVDAQTSRVINLRDYIKDASPSTVDLVRTDNLRISDRARLSVSQKR